MEAKLPVSDSLAGIVLAALIVLSALLKVLVDNEFRTVWAWIGLLLAIAIAVGAWLQMKAGDTMDTMRTERRCRLRRRLRRLRARTRQECLLRPART